MDLSKLPKLSQTPTSSENPPPISDIPCSSNPSPTSRPSPAQSPAPSPAAEAWISLAVGAILLLVAPTMLKFISSRLFHTSFAPFLNPDGTEVPYPQVYPQFLSDLCITLFAIVMIIDGVAIALIRRKPILFAIFLLTLLATLLNLLLVIFTTPTYGLPIISALSVAVGGYMAMLQLSTLRRV